MEIWTIDAEIRILYPDQIKTRTLAIKGDIDLVLGNLPKAWLLIQRVIW